MLCLSGFELYSRWVSLTAEEQTFLICPNLSYFTLIPNTSRSKGSNSDVIRFINGEVCQFY